MRDYTILKGKITFKDDIDPDDVGTALAIQHAITGITNIEYPPEYRDLAIEFTGEIHHELAKQSWEQFLTDYAPHMKAGFIFYRTGSDIAYRHTFDADHCEWILQIGVIRFVGKHGFVDHWEHAESFPRKM